VERTRPRTADADTPTPDGRGAERASNRRRRPAQTLIKGTVGFYDEVPFDPTVDAGQATPGTPATPSAAPATPVPGDPDFTG
jgi:hypothetical protein